MGRQITIDPITRLEGHGKIEIFLNEQGNVDRAYFQVPELRGFEKFVEGMPIEEVPRVVSDCGKLRARTNWRTGIPFDQSLRDLLDYWREQVAVKIQSKTDN